MNILRALLKFIQGFLSLFSNKPLENDHSEASGTLGTVLSKPLTIPHPEEPPDYSKSINNVDTFITLTEWLDSYDVPSEYWCYWRNAIDIQVYAQYPDYMLAWGVPYDCPAFAWADGGIRHIAVKPEWLNKGIIAHEQSHNSYALLTDEKQLEFETVYVNLYLADNPWLRLMDNYTDYINFPIDNESEEKETHAECYRYLCQQVPDELKEFYPKLF